MKAMEEQFLREMEEEQKNKGEQEQPSEEKKKKKKKKKNKEAEKEFTDKINNEVQEELGDLISSM